MLPAVSSNETFKTQQPKRHTANTIPISTQTKPSTNIKFCYFSQKVFSCSSALQFLYTPGLQTEPSSTQLCYRNLHFRHVQNITSISSGYSRSCGSRTCLTSVFFLLIPGAPPITEEETIYKLVLIEVKCKKHFLESKKPKVWFGTQGRLADSDKFWNSSSAHENLSVEPVSGSSERKHNKPSIFRVLK